MTAVLEHTAAVLPSGALTGSSVPQIAGSRTTPPATRGVAIVIASSALVAGCLSGTVVPASWRPQHEPFTVDVGAGRGLLTTATTAPAATAVVPASGGAPPPSTTVEAVSDPGPPANAEVATLSDQEEVRAG